MEFEKIDILTLIPQRPPFVMIDHLLYNNETSTSTSLTVREDNIFVDCGILSSTGLIENIAQTCAARMGYINLFLCKEAVKLGFIGAIKDLRIFRRPRIGDNLMTTVLITEEVFQMTVVKAEIKSGGEVLVTAIMKIALSDIEAQVNYETARI